MVMTEPLPGLTAVPAGSTNGPLTATEFASQSADRRQAEGQFAALASQPGFGAYIRLWTDRGGPGNGANDLAILIFHIPDLAQAGAFTSGLLAPFDDSHGAHPFPVPGITGARGFSIPVTTPVDATEQVLVFRAGHYVSMLQLASTTSAANPTPLTSSQAITAGFQQYALLHAGDPTGSAPAAPSTGVPSTTPAASGAPTPAPASNGSWVTAALAAVAVLALAAAVAVLIVRRRRSGSAVGSTDDPWGPDGIFAAFGAIDPRPGGDHHEGVPTVPASPGQAAGRGPAQTVPTLPAGEREAPVYLGVLGGSLQSQATN